MTKDEHHKKMWKALRAELKDAKSMLAEGQGQMDRLRADLARVTADLDDARHEHARHLAEMRTAFRTLQGELEDILRVRGLLK